MEIIEGPGEEFENDTATDAASGYRQHLISTNFPSKRD
jgi:hypothetical protein